MTNLSLPTYLLLIGLTAPSLSLSAASAPSFDCKKASTLVEQKICTTPALAEQGSKVAALYHLKAKLEKGEDFRILKADQKAWIARRENCADDECITRLTKERILELKTLGEHVSSSSLAASPSQANSNLYQNQTYGFEITFPKEMKLSKRFQGSSLVTPNVWSQVLEGNSATPIKGDVLLSLTNGRHSELRIGVRAAQKGTEACAPTPLPNAKEETINDKVFSTTAIADSGMQHFVSGKHLQIVHKGTCIVVERLLSGTSCDVYEDAAKAKCVDGLAADKKSDAQLEAVVSSIRFH